jgi:hypothetical protein
MQGGKREREEMQRCREGGGRGRGKRGREDREEWYPIIESPSNVLQVGIVKEEDGVTIHPNPQFLHARGPNIGEGISESVGVHTVFLKTNNIKKTISNEELFNTKN